MCNNISALCTVGVYFLPLQLWLFGFAGNDDNSFL